MTECFCRKTSNDTNVSRGTASIGSSSIFAIGMLLIRCLGALLPHKLLDGIGDSIVDGGGIVEELDVGMGGKDEVVGEVGNCEDEAVGAEDNGEGEVVGNCRDEAVGTEDSGEGEVVGNCRDEAVGTEDSGEGEVVGNCRDEAVGTEDSGEGEVVGI